MKVTIQGSIKVGSREVAFTAENATIEGAMRAAGLDPSSPYAIMLNGERVATAEIPTRTVRDGDVVRVGEKVGGGAHDTLPTVRA